MCQKEGFMEAGWIEFKESNRFYNRETISFIIISLFWLKSLPLSRFSKILELRKRINYLSCIEGKGGMRDICIISKFYAKWLIFYDDNYIEGMERIDHKDWFYYPQSKFYSNKNIYFEHWYQSQRMEKVQNG